MIRLAVKSDLDRIMEMKKDVVALMKQDGIMQWPGDYPSRTDFLKDIEEESLYVFESDIVLGACAIKRENDPPYEEVKGWSFDDSFVIHRMLVDPNHQKNSVAYQFFLESVCIARENNVECIKVDTHPDNYKMRNFLLKCGFRYVGFSHSIYRECYEYIVGD